jgi:hypothetical protein
LKLPEPYTFFVDRALGGKVIVGVSMLWTDGALLKKPKVMK